MKIRNAEIKDAPALAGLTAQLGYAVSEDLLLKKLKKTLEDGNSRIFVAEEGGIVLGFIAVNLISQLALEGDFLRLSYFCVDEKARGKGIGRRLEEKCSEFARERGCDRLEVHCHSRRKDAHRFYERQGFEESPKYFIKPVKTR